MTTTNTLKPIEGTSIRVQWQYLHDSPTQPRTSYPDRHIHELSESIKENGDILQDLMIRKRMSNPLRPLDTWTLEDDGYEVIFGHCRKRGGIRAGLADGPCKLVTMTDQQVQKAQLAENLNREDLTFLEEAETLARLRHNFKVDIEELRKFTGDKSRTYVYNQLKLAAASDAVKAACRDGKLNQELATLVARIPVHKLQDQALTTAMEHGRQNDGVGYRKTKRDLLEKYSLYLKDALWALDDALLVPDAGACTTCPNRSGATPELYGDVVDAKQGYYNYDTPKQGKDVCMDPTCFALKKKTQLGLDAAEEAAKGKTVITGNAAKAALSSDGTVKSGGAYVAVKDVKALLKATPGAVRPQTVLIQDQRSGKTVEAVKKSDLAGAGVAVPDPKAAESARSAKHEAEQKKWVEKTETEQAYRQDLHRDVRAAMKGKPRSTFELKELARYILQRSQHEDDTAIGALHGEKDLGQLRELVDFLSPDGLAVFMLEFAMVSDVHINTWQMRDYGPEHGCGRLRAFAEHHGFDLEAHRAAWDAAKGLSTPLTAAQAQGKGAAKKANKAAAGGKADAIPAAPGGGVCGRDPHDQVTQELPLGEAQGQPAPPVDDVLFKLSTSPAMNTPAAKAAWPFKDRQPAAAEPDTGAGVAGDTSAAAGREHDEEAAA